MEKKETYTLSNGYKIPKMGLGTFTLSPADCEYAVSEALKAGYRHIDTANIYMNEKAVGRAIKSSGLKREDIFVETKLWWTLFNEQDAVDKTLERLGLDYIDLMLIHTPAPGYLDGYRILEKAYKEGKIRSIGVSNFYQEDLDYLLSNCEIKPVVDQIETNPLCNHIEFNEYLKSKGILLQSWSPLGHGNQNVINNELITSIAKKFNKTNAQILLRWQLELGYQIIPGSKNKDHIISNADIFDFTLSKEDMDLIKTLDTGHTLSDPKSAQFNGFGSHPDIDSQE
ncbi:MAG: aldo/keto reductase [Coprobacillus sp.]|nr:aldo/keto reductase [Coprobacillus sp.]